MMTVLDIVKAGEIFRLLRHRVEETLPLQPGRYYAGARSALVYKDHWFFFQNVADRVWIGKIGREYPSVEIAIGRRCQGAVIRTEQGDFLARRPGLKGKSPVKTEDFSPRGFDEVIIGKERLFMIGEVNGLEIINRLTEFAEECERMRVAPSLRLSPRPNIGVQGMSPGPSISFDRTGHSIDPRHRPIVEALYEELKRRGWSLCQHDGVVDPDLLVRKNCRTLLIEVKPNTTRADICMAVGQTLFYEAHLPYRVQKVIACPSFDISSALGDLLDREGIKVLPFAIRSSEYHFDHAYID